MALKTVELLVPGRYRLPDERVVEYTPAHIRRAVDNGNAQLKAGLSIPFCWQHDPRAKPEYLGQTGKPGPHSEAWKARWWFADAKRFRLDPATGTAEVTLDIPDAEDGRQFDKVGRVSPGLLFDWRDEKGVLWPGPSVFHVACTPQPIQRGIRRGTRADLPHLLSHDPRRAADLHTLSFTAPWSTPMADEKDDVDMDGGEKDGATAADIAEIIDLLKQLDIHGLDDVDNVPDLKIALKAAVHTKTGGGADADQPEDAPADGGADGLSNAAPVNAPVMMSHAAQSTLAGQVAELRIKDKERTVRDLFAAGQITRPVMDKELNELKAVNLSQTADLFDLATGRFKETRQDIRLEAYAQNPKKFAHGGPVNLSHAAPVKNPFADESAEAKEKVAAQEVKDHFARKRASKQ